MYKFVQWKRACIRKRMIIHLWAAAGIAFGTPVAIFVGSWLWRFAIDAVTR